MNARAQRAQRELGFYWVKLRSPYSQLVEIAEWRGRHWLYSGNDTRWPDNAIEVLSERLTPPE